MNDEHWTRWRIELTAYGEYVELSFEDVELHTDADVARWASELRLALGHYDRRVDVLLDLRGLLVDARCAPCCAERLGQLLGRYAAGIAYFGADERTVAALEAGLGARAVHTGRLRSRAPALQQLMLNRQRRLGSAFPVHIPQVGSDAISI